MKYVTKLSGAILCFFLHFGSSQVSAEANDLEIPPAMGLPEFNSKKWLFETGNPHGFLVKFIAEGIKFVGLLAVISLTIGGIMYMTSYGAEAKTKKAKNLVVYSLVGVLVSVLAYTLVDIVTSIKIN